MDEAQKRAAYTMFQALAGGKNVRDLADDDPLKKAGMAVGDLITHLVGFLATTYPNEVVNRQMRQVWHLIGSKTVPTVLYEVRTPSVAAAQVGGRLVTVMLFPFDWAGMVEANPQNGMGALVFCGSQAIDAYNGRITDGHETVLKRARAHESEYLRTLREIDPAWVPDAYQTGVLAAFPEGVRSPAAAGLWYEPKPPPTSPPPPLVA